MKRFFLLLFVVLLACAARGVYVPSASCPPLRDGDLIFQAHKSSQATAILAATWSLYTHVGIVDVTPHGVEVLEASRTTRRTPLAEFLAHGVQERYDVYRLASLTDAEAGAAVTAAEQYLGRPYDPFFLDGDDALYCSELAHLAYRDAGVSLGAAQRVRELHLDNPPVRELIASRWQRHPLCQDKGMTFEACHARILDQTLVTPISLARDTEVTKVCGNMW